MLRIILPSFCLLLLGLPANAQTVYQPFGNGMIANAPGQHSTTYQPFGIWIDAYVFGMKKPAHSHWL